MSDNRQNIINATDLLLQTDGLARLTRSKIARKAKVAEGLIYQHFRDKAELIFEAVETRLHENKNLMQNLPLEVGNMKSRLSSVLFLPINIYTCAYRRLLKRGMCARNTLLKVWLSIWQLNKEWGGYRLQ